MDFEQLPGMLESSNRKENVCRTSENSHRARTCNPEALQAVQPHKPMRDLTGPPCLSAARCGCGECPVLPRERSSGRATAAVVCWRVPTAVPSCGARALAAHSHR